MQSSNANGRSSGGSSRRRRGYASEEEEKRLQQIIDGGALFGSSIFRGKVKKYGPYREEVVCGVLKAQYTFVVIGVKEEDLVEGVTMFTGYDALYRATLRLEGNELISDWGEGILATVKKIEDAKKASSNEGTEAAVSSSSSSSPAGGETSPSEEGIASNTGATSTGTTSTSTSTDPAGGDTSPPRSPNTGTATAHAVVPPSVVRPSGTDQHGDRERSEDSPAAAHTSMMHTSSSAHLQPAESGRIGASANINSSTQVVSPPRSPPALSTLSASSTTNSAGKRTASDDNDTYDIESGSNVKRSRTEANDDDQMPTFHEEESKGDEDQGLQLDIEEDACPASMPPGSPRANTPMQDISGSGTASTAAVGAAALLSRADSTPRRSATEGRRGAAVALHNSPASNLRALLEDSEENKARAQSLEASVQALEEEKNRMEAEKNRMEAEKNRMETEINTLEEEKSGCEAEKTRLETEKNSVEAKLAAEIASLKKKVEEWKRSQDRYKQEKDKYKKDYDEEKKARSEADNKIASNKKLIDRLNEKLKRKDQEIRRLKEASRNAFDETMSSTASPAEENSASAGPTTRNHNEAPEPDDESKEIRSKIESMVLSPANMEQVTLDDIVGMSEIKEAIEFGLVVPMRNPDYYEHELPLKGALLYGPPGTGKTMIAKAIACEAQATFISVKASKIASKWFGQTERAVELLFTVAREKKKCIIFIDEIDTLGASRNGKESGEASSKVLAQFLIETDGAHSTQLVDGKIPAVAVIGATNRPQDVDDALRRRLSQRLMAPLPAAADRLSFFRLRLENFKGTHCLTDDEVVKLVDMTEMYSFADLDEICKLVEAKPQREVTKKYFDRAQRKIVGISVEEHRREVLERELTFADYFATVKDYSPSADEETIRNIENFHNSRRD